SKSLLTSGTSIFTFGAHGYNGSANVAGGGLTWVTTQDWSVGANGSKLQILLAPNGDILRTRGIFWGSGSLALGTTANSNDPGSGGLYADGAGIYFPNLATTASAANAFIDNATSPANQLKRSTSSLHYKRDVEPLDPALALKVLADAKPIW